MAIGVVVDTNIFVHAADENIHCCQHCIDVLTHLLHSKEDYINVDIKFNFLEEAKNGSVIGEEYLQHMPSGGLGETMILQAIADDRITFLKEPHWHIKKKIRIEFGGMKIPDQFFLAITYSSKNKILISEDFEDYRTEIRREIKSMFNIKILQAKEIFQTKKTA